MVLATLGLAVSGFGYFWFTTRFVSVVTRSQGFACAVWSIVIAFPLRQLMSAALDGFMDPSQQVLVAIVLPIFAALILASLQRRDPKATQLIQGESVDVAEGKGRSAESSLSELVSYSERSRDVVVALVASALLLAIVRVFGLSGTWGDSRFFYFDELGRLPGILVLTVCLAVFAYFALIRLAERPIMLRFQPAILLIVSGLFVVIFRAQLSGDPSPVLEGIVEINDPLAHLLFWATVSSAILAMNSSPLRIAGLAGAVYAATSILYVLFLRGDGMLDTAAILLVVYILVALVINRSWFNRKSGVGVDSLNGTEKRATASIQTEGDSATRLNATIVERCTEIAKQYALSPRETEVFLLLAQGRTGTSIQQELVLAESTVKTHMSHIYTKMKVSGRQEMMALVFAENEEVAAKVENA